MIPFAEYRLGRVLPAVIIFIIVNVFKNFTTTKA